MFPMIFLINLTVVLDMIVIRVKRTVMTLFGRPVMLLLALDYSPLATIDPSPLPMRTPLPTFVNMNRALPTGGTRLYSSPPNVTLPSVVFIPAAPPAAIYTALPRSRPRPTIHAWSPKLVLTLDASPAVQTMDTASALLTINVEPVHDTPVFLSIFNTLGSTCPTSPIYLLDAAPTVLSIDAAPAKLASEPEPESSSAYFLNAASILLTIDAAPILPTIDAAPILPTIDAAPIHLWLAATSVYPTLNAATLSMVIAPNVTNAAVSLAAVDDDTADVYHNLVTLLSLYLLYRVSRTVILSRRDEVEEEEQEQEQEQEQEEYAQEEERVVRPTRKSPWVDALSQELFRRIVMVTAVNAKRITDCLQCEWRVMKPEYPEVFSWIDDTDYDYDATTLSALDINPDLATKVAFSVDTTDPPLFTPLLPPSPAVSAPRSSSPPSSPAQAAPRTPSPPPSPAQSVPRSPSPPPSPAQSNRGTLSPAQPASLSPSTLRSPAQPLSCSPSPPPSPSQSNLQTLSPAQPIPLSPSAPPSPAQPIPLSPSIPPSPAQPVSCSPSPPASPAQSNLQTLSPAQPIFLSPSIPPSPAQIISRSPSPPPPPAQSNRGTLSPAQPVCPSPSTPPSPAQSISRSPSPPPPPERSTSPLRLPPHPSSSVQSGPRMPSPPPQPIDRTPSPTQMVRQSSPPPPSPAQSIARPPSPSISVPSLSAQSTPRHPVSSLSALGIILDSPATSASTGNRSPTPSTSTPPPVSRMPTLVPLQTDLSQVLAHSDDIDVHIARIQALYDPAGPTTAAHNPSNNAFQAFIDDVCSAPSGSHSASCPSPPSPLHIPQHATQISRFGRVMPTRPTSRPPTAYSQSISARTSTVATASSCSSPLSLSVSLASSSQPSSVRRKAPPPSPVMRSSASAPFNWRRKGKKNTRASASRSPRC